MITAKELAARLNGREYGNEVFPQDEIEAARSGLVIMTGHSDDLVELHGAVQNEIGAFGGAKFALDGGGRIYTGDSIPRGATRFEAVWGARENGFPWSYRTTVPHETFAVYEDDDKYCLGLVFRLADCRPAQEGQAELDALRAEKKRLLRELEAAKADIHELIVSADYPGCGVYCKNFRECAAHEDNPDYDCDDHAEWRGPCAENGGTNHDD